MSVSNRNGGAETAAGDFEAVKARLEEIARAVEDDSLPLDDALDLYEEAVKLGLEASNLLETGIVVDDREEDVVPDAMSDSSDAGSPVAEV